MSIVTLEERQPRRPLMRGLLIYGPLSLPLVLGLKVGLEALFDGQRGALVPLSLLSVFSAALAYYLIIHALDLRAAPVYTRGPIERRWTKGNLLFFFRTYFVRVGGRVFAVAPGTYARVEEEEVLELHHWPRTHAVFAAYVLEGADADREPDEAPVRPLPA